ncbi:hypothetical protein ABI59_13680 [Acidobacteria bacterium Mor1]|nr:hypothetical protein ABI59_13680 [Acidobacteria bacterium Mor1]
MNEAELRSFRQGYRELLADGPATEVSDEEIASLITDDLPEDAREALMAKVLAAPDGLERYRELQELHDAAHAESSAAATARRRGPLLALAAMLIFGLLAAGWFMNRETTGTAPVLRSVEDASISTPLAADAGLPRSAFVLRWILNGAAGEDVRFELRISDDDAPLSTIEDLSEPRYDASSIVADLPDGTPIYFKVTARLADGRTVDSETFIVRIK